MIHWKEASGKTSDMLEGLYLPTGMVVPQDPLEKLDKVAGESEVWASVLRLVLPMTQLHIRSRRLIQSQYCFKQLGSNNP